jgi:cytochrome c-type biogenesis protein CcmF
MIPELGHFALIVAFALALVQGVLPIAGAHKGNGAWMAVARPAAQGQMVFVALAFASLTHAFVANDFSLTYVASHSNSQLPLQYRIAGVWGGHEGSLLLWVLLLTLWGAAVTVFSRHLPEEMVARVLGVMGLVSVGFLAFLLLTSNPFERLLPAAADGRDLNPLLQDPGMVLHPPLLYMGYVGFSVAFAFSLAALLGGRLDAAWARWSRPWTTAAWLFLTLGIALGSFWAYYELGWGGWWFWDPVENASFMPWLMGTALIHSLAVTEKRGGFKNWTVLLAILAFSLSLLGTFLVRSGVLTSVHAFATDPRRGIFILAFLVVVIGSSLALFAWRAPKVGLGGGFELVSREAALLINNVLLAVAAAAVMLGTLYPLFLDALGLGKISVGPPYFETVIVPLVAPVAVLLAVGPYVRWKAARLGEIFARLRWPAAAAAALALVLAAALGARSALMLFGLLLASWVLLASSWHLVERLRQPAGGSVWVRLRSQPRAYYGMLLAHLGVGVFALGVTVVKGLETSQDVRMKPGDTTTVAGYTFRFGGVQELRGPNYIAARATVEVTRGAERRGVLYPEKRLYTASGMPMTEAAIDRGVLRDLYVSLGEPVSPEEWIVRVNHKPFVNWIWGGCLLMALGGGLAASDRRYRLARARGTRTAAATAGV